MEIVSAAANYQNFKGLDYSKVLQKDQKFVKANLNKLQEFGKSYDIVMESCFVNHPDFSSIDVYVMPLKDKMSFWQRLFCPKGISSFDAYKNDAADGLTAAAAEAINHLKRYM